MNLPARRIAHLCADVRYLPLAQRREKVAPAGYRAELTELIHLNAEAAREIDPNRQDDLIYHLVQC